jgi:CRISPR/Cas system-associated exonuclease Cas4 (RecB family)
MPMPGVFSAINTRLQGTLVGRDLQTLSKDLPEGTVENQEGWVESKPVPGTDVFIKGKYDLLVKRPDGTHLLVDLKISQPDVGKIDKYKTQLTAYKFALENPANGKPIKLTKLGLLIFYPDTVSFEKGIVRLDFPPKWLEVPIADAEFLTFAKVVDKLLKGPTPEEGKECKWCKYRHLGDKLTHYESLKEDIPF